MEAIKPDVSGLGGRLRGALKTDSESIKVGVSDLAVGVRNIKRKTEFYESIDPKRSLI